MRNIPGLDGAATRAITDNRCPVCGDTGSAYGSRENPGIDLWIEKRGRVTRFFGEMVIVCANNTEGAYSDECGAQWSMRFEVKEILGI